MAALTCNVLLHLTPV